MARAPGGPRTRYVAFRIEAAEPPSRQGLIAAIRDAGRALHGARFEEETGCWLTRFKDTHGIVRCHHDKHAAVVAALAAVARTSGGQPIALTPLATSGTIRTLVERHVPELKEARDTKRGQAEARAARARGAARPPSRGRRA